MSWDKYNEARKKANQAKSKLEKASKTADKLTGKSGDKLTKTEINQAKTAYKNAKSNKWLAAIFIIITIVMLGSLFFSDFFEAKINNTFERDGVITAITDARDNSTMNITYVNVLQGDCILINLPDGKNMIIDAGSSFRYKNSEIEALVIEQIRTNLLGDGNNKIDYMIMTHADYDHFSYMQAILEEFEVVKMYRPNVYFGIAPEDEADASASDKALAAAEEARAEAAEAAYVTEEMYRAEGSNYNGYNVKTDSVAAYGNTLEDMYAEAETNGGESEVLFTFEIEKNADGVGVITNAEDPNVTEDEIYTFKFYAPLDNKHLYTDWNNYSAFITLEYQDLTYCFTGDTEAELEAEIIARYGDILPDVDIMDAGHHGSSTSSSSELLEILKPEVVICSCDDGSEYGHPAQDALDRFVAAGVATNCIFTTNNNGNICVALDYTGGDENTETGDTSSTESGDNSSTAGAENTGDTTTSGQTTDTSTADDTTTSGSATESEVTEVSEPEFAYVIGITTNGEVSVTEFKWWYIVVTVIVVAAVALLIIAPSIIKAMKKKN